jgi:23S rRNA (guanosine2251-2'-O)-methyltransferase
MPRQKFVQIENKNALLELLAEGKDFEKIYIAFNAYKDPKTTEIISAAGRRKIQVVKVSRKVINKLSRTPSTESVIGMMVADNLWDLRDLMEKLYSEGRNPFFLLLDHVKYDQNVGAILRTAFAAGVNGVITPIKSANFLSNETLRVSMGTSARIPLVEMNLFSAIREMKKDDVKVYALAMEGKEFYKKDLRGPVAFVLGAEDVGISTRVLEKVDDVISIPMREGIGSLNVSASAAVICYEKLRQEVA